MTNSVQTFYTGGGITIAEVNVDKTHYAVVSSDAPDYITVYRYNTDNETTYLSEDMVSCLSKENITSELQPLYAKMVAALQPVG